jgi:predicted 3-demethylubiquinone-9 3-methyltransferase (glyoxalase superfamily)
MPRITPNLWFDTQAEEAAQYYIDALGGDGKITTVTHYGPEDPAREGTVMYLEFELHGQPFAAINGGPQFPFTEAVSLEVRCEDQAEVDRVWAALSADGEEGPCGWLKDRYGLSWQVTPRILERLHDGEPEGVRRLMSAMLASHGKFDVAALQKAYDGA